MKLFWQELFRRQIFTTTFEQYRIDMLLKIKTAKKINVLNEFSVLGANIFILLIFTIVNVYYYIIAITT